MVSFGLDWLDRILRISEVDFMASSVVSLWMTNGVFLTKKCIKSLKK